MSEPAFDAGRIQKEMQDVTARQKRERNSGCLSPFMDKELSAKTLALKKILQQRNDRTGMRKLQHLTQIGAGSNIYVQGLATMFL
jgi:hypothetical protein